MPFTLLNINLRIAPEDLITWAPDLFTLYLKNQVTLLTTMADLVFFDERILS